MTRSKLEFATILSMLRGSGEDPQELAANMTLRKLCHEIEKIEEATEAAKPPIVEPKVQHHMRPLWSRLTLDDDDD